MITAADIQTIRNNDPGAVLPGIDTMTGNPYATSSLLDVTKITQNFKAPYYYSPSKNAVYVFQAGAVLSGINFGSATVFIEANNVTIKDSTFAGTTGFWAVNQAAAFSGATVENCTFTGSKSPTEGNVWIVSRQGITIENNSFLNSPVDAIAVQAGVVTGNYFSGGAYSPGAHADAIYVPDSTGPTVITDNFIDSTQDADAPGPSNSAIRITDEGGNLNGVTVSGNYLFGGTYTVEAGAVTGNAYTFSNVSVANNDIGFWMYGPFYPSPTTAEGMSENTMVDFSNPTVSTQALAAYQAAGLPGAGASGSAPTTVLGNGVAGAHLGAGSGETNFVGGQGEQYLNVGQGAAILTYLAIGDRGDWISGFDPAKDVIDLSHIDADLTTPGLQNFIFIGTAPFSGGAQVRYQLNPTTGLTTVQAALAGDPTADFTLTLGGLFPLTAANFALTPSQSSADLADGAALTLSKVPTAAGAPTEYLHSNVEGRAYTSYQAFWGGSALVADDLSLSPVANELILYGPNLTVTRGGGSEALQMGTGSDPLSYQPVETIDANARGSENFVFSAGFGKETINGFSASGASPDSIQLTKSSFSYLTASMTQAQDLATVLANGATQTALGLTISDSHGDSLALAGLTSAMVAASPAMIQFT